VSLSESIRTVLEKSKHRHIQAQASLALAQQAERRISLAQLLKGNPDSARDLVTIMGRPAVVALVKAGPDKLKKEAEALYERTRTIAERVFRPAT